MCTNVRKLDREASRGRLKDLERRIGNPRAILTVQIAFVPANGTTVITSTFRLCEGFSGCKTVKRRSDSEEMAPKLVFDRRAGNRRQICR